MQQSVNIVVTCVYAVLMATLAVFGDSGMQQQDDRDIFKVFQSHPFGVAVLDADNDGDLDCLTAVRTKFDPSGPAADYVWILPGVNGRTKQNITVHFEKGEGPDRASVYVNDATDQRLEARAIYADYKTCAVLSIPYNQDPHCILWATDEAKDNVPSKCRDQFLNNCYNEVPTYDKETCSQV